MSKYKAILFDYDGTLMDTNELVMASWQHMANVLVGHSLPEEELYATYGKPLEDCMRYIKEKYNLACDAIKMCDVYRDYQINHVKEKRHPFPGTDEMLKGLKEKGLKTGIVTSRFNDSTEEGLRLFGLWQYFDALVGADDTHIHKPNPEPAILCCKKLDVDPKDCLMVGDSVFDLQCGHNAGNDACFVTWSVCTTIDKAVKEASPEYIINTPQELINLL